VKQRGASLRRLSRLVYQDLRDLDTVKDLSKIELLVDALPSKVGSVLSINSLKEDLEVSPNTVSHWLLVLETIYYSYRILPFGGPKIRAVKKSNKLYLWDWAEIENTGARFVRDTDLREIDFVVLKNKKPIFAIECKTGDTKMSPHLRYFKERLPIPLFYQVHLGEKEWDEGNIKVRQWESFWKERVKELVAS
jgi:hypothetical protein